MLALALVCCTARPATLAAVDPGPLGQDAILLSFSGYCGLAVTNFSCYWCKQLGDSFETVGTFGEPSSISFGYVGILRGTYVAVVWRGTDNIAGFIRDADFTQTQFPNAPAGVRCHTGFLELVSLLQPNVMKLYNQAQRQCGGNCHVLFTGHSLGAAMSTMSAVMFGMETGGHVDSHVLNFGSPRIFNPAGAAWLVASLPGLNVSTHLRVTSMHDPVPHLPPQDFLEHYAHSATEMWEVSNSPLAFKQCSGGEDPSCSDSVEAWQMDVADHARYLGHDIFDGIAHGCLFSDEFPLTK